MNKNTMSIFIIITSFIIAFPAIGENYRLIYEEGFETKASGNLPNGWQTKINRGTNAEFNFDDAEKHGGNGSYKIAVKPPGGSITLFKESNVKNIKPGKKYELSVWVKAKDLGYSPNFIAPAFRYNYSPDRISPVPTLDLMYLLKGEAGWKNLTYATTAPASAQEITLDVVLTKGTLWIDDIQIFEVGN
jgi:hypothetical protein